MNKQPLLPLFILFTICTLSVSSQGVPVNRQLSAPSSAIGGDIDRYRVSPDGDWFVYIADQDVNNVRELYSVPTDRSTAPVKLNIPLSGEDDIISFKISPDSTTVAWVEGQVDETTEDRLDLYTNLIGGGTPAKLNGPGTFAQGDYFFTPDSTRVVAGITNEFQDFEGDDNEPQPDVNERDESLEQKNEGASRGDYYSYGSSFLHSIPAQGGSELTLFSAPDGRQISEFQISPDGANVALLSDVETTETFELYIVSASGGLPIKLNDDLTTDGTVDEGIQFTPDSSRVVYRAEQVFENSYDLYAADINGSAPPVLLSNPVDGSDVEEFVITTTSNRVVFVQENDNGDDVLNVNLLDGSTTPTELTPLVENNNIAGLVLSPNNVFALFESDLEETNNNALYLKPIIGTDAPLKVSQDAVLGGDLIEFLVSPDSRSVVYRGDFAIESQNNLYSRSLPVQSSPMSGFLFMDDPTTLNLTLTDSRSDVSAFNISPDSSTVVFIADAEEHEINELYSVPISGGQNTKLSGPLDPGENVSSKSNDPIDISLLFASANRVGFFGILDNAGTVDLYNVPTNGASNPTRLNDQLALGGEVNTQFYITPNASRVIYEQEKFDSTTQELFSVPIDGGTDVRLNPPVPPNSFIDEISVSSDSSRVVFKVAEGSGPSYGRGPSVDPVDSIYVANVDGSNLLEVDSNRTEPGDFRNIEFILNNNAIIYLKDSSDDFGDELFASPVTQPSPTRISDQLTTGGSVGSYEVTGNRVVYRADQELDNLFRLYSVILASSSRELRGGLSSISLTPNVTGSEDVNDFKISPDGTTVVYESDDFNFSRDEIYAVPITGGSPIKLNSEFISAGDTISFQIDPTSQYVVYLADAETDRQDELYTVPIDGSTTAVKLNDTLNSSTAADVQGNYLITPDGSHVIFEADVRSSSQEDLFAAPIAGGPTTLLSDFPSVRFIQEKAISPNSQLVAFSYQADSELTTETLVVTDLSGNVISQLESDYYFENLSFTPNSDFVIFAEGNAQDGQQIFIYPVAGGSKVLVNGAGNAAVVYADDPEFSPMRRFVVYTAEQNQQGSTDLYSTEFIPAPSAFVVE